MPTTDTRAALERATVRLEILQDRMRGCPAHEADSVHDLSILEIEGWIEEQRDLLALSAPEERFSVYRDGSCVATNLLADPGAREVGYSIVRHCSAPPVAQGAEERDEYTCPQCGERDAVAIRATTRERTCLACGWKFPPMAQADPTGHDDECGAVTTLGGAFPPMACTLPAGHQGSHDADSVRPVAGSEERVDIQPSLVNRAAEAVRLAHLCDEPEWEIEAARTVLAMGVEATVAALRGQEVRDG